MGVGKMRLISHYMLNFVADGMKYVKAQPLIVEENNERILGVAVSYIVR
jgi:hypothetical protein